jgi:hypothetical protein
MNSQGAERPSVKKVPVNVANVPDAVSSSAQTQAARKMAGGLTASGSRAPRLVYQAAAPPPAT